MTSSQNIFIVCHRFIDIQIEMVWQLFLFWVLRVLAASSPTGFDTKTAKNLINVICIVAHFSTGP